MKDNISPEEKLLRLIRGEKESKSSDLPHPGLSANKKITFRIANLKLFIKNSLFSLIHTYSTPKYIRKGIFVLMTVSFIYLIASFIYPLVGLKKIKLPAVTKEKMQEPIIVQKEETKPYEFYLGGTRERQIFGNASGQEAGISAVATEVQSIKDIILVGIISGENPVGIIEDKNTQKTHYVTKGQFIGEFQVEDIQEGKLILNYKGQRYELYM